MRTRLDSLIAERGLAPSRTAAAESIRAGKVRIGRGGEKALKPGQMVAEDVHIELEEGRRYVSRGGLKLEAALDAFAVDPAGRDCLDVGASTGGFTHVLITRGAARVHAVDVGRDQLHASLRADPRVVSLEQTDARALTRTHVREPPSLIVCDASFIGAAKVLAAPFALAAERAAAIVLIKPQFEAGPHKNAVLDEPTARAAAQAAIEALDGLERFRVIAAIDSPIRGGDGNLERLVHLKR